MFMASHLKQTDLLKAMAGQTATSGWDVVCSYDLEKINEILKKSYLSRKLSGSVKFSAHYENPLDGKAETIQVTLSLSDPYLAFLPEHNGLCQVTIKIASATYKRITESSQSVIEEGKLPEQKYQIVAVAPLAAVCGSNVESVVDGNVVEFTQTQEDIHKVVIDFATDNAYMQVQPVADLDSDNTLKIVLSKIGRYFQHEVSKLQVMLACINSVEMMKASQKARKAEEAKRLAEVKKALKSGHLGSLVRHSHRGSVTIEPKSFVITTSSSDKSGALSIFIQTKNSGRPQGEASPSFKPSGNEVLPIPQGQGASIIFSRDFIQAVLLKNQLPKRNYKSVIVHNDSAPWSVAANYDLEKKVSAKSKYKKFVEATSETIDLNFKKPNYAYQFSHHADKITVSLPALSVSYKWKMPHRGVGPMGMSMPIKTGKVKVKISLDKAFSFKASSTELSIDMPISSSDYLIEYSNPKHFKSDCKKYNKSMSDAIKKVLPRSHGLFKKINFSLLTDLLFPGEEKVQVGDKDIVYVPCDVVLFGDFK